MIEISLPNGRIIRTQRTVPCVLVKIQVEWTLLSLAYNLLKLHHKAKTDRLGTGLVMPKQFPAGL